MIERKTALNQIEITSNGTVQVRIALSLVEDGKPLGEPRWHRTSIAPGASTADQMALVNAGLASMGENPVSETDIARIADFAAVAHTPEVIAAYQAAQAAVAETA